MSATGSSTVVMPATEIGPGMIRTESAEYRESSDCHNWSCPHQRNRSLSMPGTNGMGLGYSRTSTGNQASSIGMTVSSPACG